MRRRFPLWTPLAQPLLLAAALAQPPPDSTPDPPPNAVFILADDWGWGDLGCYGHERIRTPRLDGLARGGTLFTQFYVNSGVCSPSRTAFLTGQFPARHRIHGHLAGPEQNRRRGMPDWLDPAAPMVSRLLQRAGYATAHFGKWHLGSGPQAPSPESYGFDRHRLAGAWSEGQNLWDPGIRSRSSELIVNEAIAFIEESRDRPFFVNVWLLDTHATLNPTPEQLSPYERLDPAGVPFRAAAAIYSAAATDSDRHIGRLLDRLDELDLASRTIVIFSADNGPEDIGIRNASHSGVGSAGPFRGRKRSLYEGGLRVPFIASWPGRIPAGRVDDASVVTGVDFLPTVLKLAGVDLPEGIVLDGEDRSDTLLGEPRPREKPIFWEWRFRVFGHVLHRSPMLAIREGPWKLLLNPDQSRVELFDIPADPSELENVAGREAAVVEKLSRKLLDWQKTLPEGPVEPEAGRNDYPWPRPAG